MSSLSRLPDHRAAALDVALWDLVPVPLVASKDGTVLHVNTAACRLLDLDQNKAVGTDRDAIWYSEFSVLSSLRSNILTQQAGVLRYEAVGRRGDGSEIAIVVSESSSGEDIVVSVLTQLTPASTSHMVPLEVSSLVTELAELRRDVAEIQGMIGVEGAESARLRTFMHVIGTMFLKMSDSMSPEDFEAALHAFGRLT